MIGFNTRPLKQSGDGGAKEHTLSTCLFLPSVFVMQQDQDHQLHPYPLKFHQQGEAPADYSRFYSTADQNASGQVAFWAMSRSPV